MRQFKRIESIAGDKVVGSSRIKLLPYTYKHLTSCTNQNRIDRTKKENLEDEQNQKLQHQRCVCGAGIRSKPMYGVDVCKAYIDAPYRIDCIVLCLCFCHQFTFVHNHNSSVYLSGIDYSSIYLPKNKKTATKHADIHSQKDIHPAIVNAQNDSVQIGL